MKNKFLLRHPLKHWINFLAILYLTQRKFPNVCSCLVWEFLSFWSLSFLLSLAVTSWDWYWSLFRLATIASRPLLILRLFISLTRAKRAGNLRAMISWEANNANIIGNNNTTTTTNNNSIIYIALYTKVLKRRFTMEEGNKIIKLTLPEKQNNV